MSSESEYCSSTVTYGKETLTKKKILIDNMGTRIKNSSVSLVCLTTKPPFDITWPLKLCCARSTSCYGVGQFHYAFLSHDIQPSEDRVKFGGLSSIRIMRSRCCVDKPPQESLIFVSPPWTYASLQSRLSISSSLSWQRRKSSIALSAHKCFAGMYHHDWMLAP